METQPQNIDNGQVLYECALRLQQELTQEAIEKIYRCIDSHKVRPASAEEVLQSRIELEEFFLIKAKEQLWIGNATLEEEFKNLRVAKNLKAHLCMQCSNCSALNPNGCPKVKDFFITNREVQRRIGREKWQHYVIKSKRLEKYEIVKAGYESVNNYDGLFSVIECQNFKMESQKKAIKDSKEAMFKAAEINAQQKLNFASKYQTRLEIERIKANYHF